MHEPLFATLLNVALIVLKLCNVISMPWIALVFVEIIIFIGCVFVKGLIVRFFEKYN